MISGGIEVITQIRLILEAKFVRASLDLDLEFSFIASMKNSSTVTIDII